MPGYESPAVVLVDGARADVCLVHVVICVEYLLMHLGTWRLGCVLILLLACIHVLRSVACAFWPTDFIPFNRGIVLVTTRHALFQELKTALRISVVLARVVGRHHLVARGKACLIATSETPRGAHATELSSTPNIGDVLLGGLVVRVSQV